MLGWAICIPPWPPPCSMDDIPPDEPPHAANNAADAAAATAPATGGVILEDIPYLRESLYSLARDMVQGSLPLVRQINGPWLPPAGGDAAVEFTSPRHLPTGQVAVAA